MNIPYKKQYVRGELINPIEDKRATLYPNRKQRRLSMRKLNKKQ